jgi:L-glyceraldehyde 3-phosphate reductase
MLDRWIEDGLLDVLTDLGVGSIAYSPLEQGLLTGRYLRGIPADSRAAGASPFLTEEKVTEELLGRLRRLDEIAGERGQSLAQMALAWVLQKVTSAVIGASSIAQLDDSVAAVGTLEFTEEELARIDLAIAGDGSAGS